MFLDVKRPTPTCTKSEMGVSCQSLEPPGGLMFKKSCYLEAMHLFLRKEKPPFPFSLSFSVPTSLTSSSVSVSASQSFSLSLPDVEDD